MTVLGLTAIIVGIALLILAAQIIDEVLYARRCRKLRRQYEERFGFDADHPDRKRVGR